MNTTIDAGLAVIEGLMNAPYREPKKLTEAVKGKTVLITGASSGIGRGLAIKLAGHGAHIIAIARRQELLDELAVEIQTHGGKATVFAADLNDEAAVSELTAKIKSWYKIDVLINNAGKSIRRSIESSVDRFHDFERTMQLNYFGALRITQALVPHMINSGGGHVINISSIGAAANVPRFSAYAASKAALDAYSRCLSHELRHKGIRVSTVFMPLVRTEMVAPTKFYQQVPMLSIESATNIISGILVSQRTAFRSPLAKLAQWGYFAMPWLNEFVMNTTFRTLEEAPRKIKRTRRKVALNAARRKGAS